MGAIFDGTDYVTGGDNLDLDRNDSSAWSLWYKADVTSPSSRYALISKMDGSPFTGWQVQIRGDTAGDPLTVLLIEDSSSSNLSVQFARPNDTDWHHVLIVYDGSSTAAGVQLWVDGTEESATVDDDTLSGSIANTASFNLGARTDGSLLFEGSLAEVAIWGGAGVENMGQTEVDLLASGVRPPNLVEFSSQLVFYAGLFGRINSNTPLNDIGPTLTNNGATFDTSDHPPVLPSSWRFPAETFTPAPARYCPSDNLFGVGQRFP